MGDTSFDGLLLAIYDAAEDPALWQPCLELLSAATASANSAIIRHNLVSNRAAGIHHGFDQRAIESYFGYFCTVNPWLPQAGYTEPPPDAKRAYRGIDYLPASKFRRTEFYADWGRRCDVVNSIGAGLAVEGTDLIYLCFGRSERDGPHTEAEVSLTTRLLPHMRRALGLGRLRAQVANLRAAVQAMQQACVLVDRHGRLVERTEQAARLLNSRTVLTVDRSGRLATLNPADRPVWESILAGGAPSLTTLAGTAKGHEVVAAADTVRGATSSTGPFTGANSDLLVIALVPVAALPHEDQWRRAAALYGLTPAESRLVATLMGGGSLEHAAEQLNVTRNTVKTQMSAIFRKTGTSRQAEVIRLFAQIGAITRMGDDTPNGRGK